VLYRRWSGKDKLVIAAIRHYGQAHPVQIPDTGTLRGDMLELLGRINDARSYFTVVVAAAFAGLLAHSGRTPADVRAQLISDRPLLSDEVFRRADERGEINLDKIPAAILSMPFDLMRHDLLMTLKPIPTARITEIVDDLFLPLIAAHT